MRVLYLESDQTLFTDPFDAPDVNPGDVIVCQVPYRTLKGEYYYVGDTFEIIERTWEAPHRRITTMGNWLVRGKDGEITVWSNVELMLAERYAYVLVKLAA